MENIFLMKKNVNGYRLPVAGNWFWYGGHA